MTTEGNYLSAIFDYRSETVKVWERHGDQRVLKTWPAPYYFYVEDEGGEYTSLFDKKLSRMDFEDGETFDAACKRFQVKYESDISPLDKVLMNNYYGKPLPQINVSFIDIENDWKSQVHNGDKLVKVKKTSNSPDIEMTVAELRNTRDKDEYEVWCTMRKKWVDAQTSDYMYMGPTGYSSVEEAYAPINAVTIYHQWIDTFYTLVVPPKNWDGKWNTEAHPNFDFDAVIICKNDAELLTKLLVLIKDTDIISGWNSEFFDMPYMMRRTEIALGKEQAMAWCFPGARAPKYKEVERFGSPHLTVSLSGRVHLDFLDLFKKFNLGGRPSYSLAAITNTELEVPKMEYDGTLEELYNNDFSHFVVYNYVDVQNLRDLNRKFKYIELASRMARENTVPLEAVLGTVKLVETGITNFAHHTSNVIVHDKKIVERTGKVEGAIVLTPKIGLHEWLASVDLKSLYPSTIRSLNISPEMIIGQFTQFESDWFGIYNKDSTVHYLRFNDGEVVEATGEEWFEVLRNKKWAISGYGTIFDQSRGPGLVTQVLSYWYSERKRLQGEKKKWTKEVEKLKNTTGKTYAKKLSFEDECNVKNGILIHYSKKLYTRDEWTQIDAAQKQEESFDLLQGVKKVQLNSSYGALLNAFFRYGSAEMGASVTGSGRQITTHMIGAIGEILTGDLTPLVKSTERLKDGTIQNVYISPNKSIIYSDTDSAYFLTFADCVDDAAEIADSVAETVNSTFPDFMRNAFNCQPGFDDLISAGREIVGRRGLFQSRKKYVIKVVDNEGFRTDKIKSQGSELKKSDTPVTIQNFLKDVLTAILDGDGNDVLEKIVNGARGNLITKKNVLQLGVSKSVNSLDETYLEWTQFEKPGHRRVRLSGGQRAAINYNEHVKFRNDTSAGQIKSGDKIMTFNLKKNQFGYLTIALPADTTHLPEWFNSDFEIDLATTEQKLIDAKLKSIFAALGTEVPTFQGTHFAGLFDF